MKRNRWACSREWAEGAEGVLYFSTELAKPWQHTAVRVCRTDTPKNNVAIHQNK